MQKNGSERYLPGHLIVGLRGCSARLRGVPDLPPFEAAFRAGVRNPFRASLNVDRVHLPLHDGDEAVVLPGGTSATLSVGLTGGKSDTGLLIEGNDVSALRLDDSRIELSRGSDLLDLTFQSKGFELKRRGNGSSYLRWVRQHGGCEPATITLLLPPQHVTESTIKFEGGGLSAAMKKRGYPARPLLSVGDFCWRG